MEKFTLLVGGKDLDTGIYHYFPFTEKLVAEPQKAVRMLKKVKQGQVSREIQKYVYAQYCINTEDTNRAAIESAYKAQKIFFKFSLSKRRQILLDIYKLLIENRKKFIELLIIEGHPRRLAEWEFEGMQIGSSPTTINFYCQLIQKELGRCGREILYWVRRPDGVVCVSPPGNASASSSYNAILAFLTGNTLIIKPPLKVPLSTLFLWKEIVNKALVINNAPPGVLNIVIGNSQKIMEEWLASPYVNDIVYFGESRKGLEIGTRIFQAEKKPVLELSGNDLFLVWKDAEKEKSSISLTDAFLGSTQICMVPKIALIHEEVYDDFVKIFIEKVKKLKIGPPTDPDTIFSPVTKIQDFFEFLNDALAKGGEILYGGERVDYFGRPDSTGMYIQPTLLKIEDCYLNRGLRCIEEEIFFPLLPLIRVSGGDEAIFEKMVELVNSHGYGLRVSLWISSFKFLRKFAKELSNCGMLRINSRHVGFSYYLSTHGGTRKSGGPFGEMNYFWQKTSHLQGVSRTRL